jgi:protein-disulfide isomerase
MRRPVERVLDLGTFLCALALTGLLAWHELRPVKKASDRGDRAITNWAAVAAVGHRIGPRAADVTVVEFADFQCAYCADFARRALPLIRQRQPTVAFVYRHWPLSIHPFAFDAAVVAECAAEQGRFEAIHDALFANQDSIGVWPYDRFARLAEVPDLAKFARCRANPAVRARVDTDRRSAIALGARGTPTFIVNGVLLAGPLDESRLDSLVRASRP